MIRLRHLPALLLLLSTTVVLAQENANLEQGLKPFGAYHGGDLDTVSLSNGNLAVRIPLVSYPQRGKLSFGLSIINNDKNWEGYCPVQNPCNWAYRWRNSTSGHPVLSTGATIVNDGDFFLGIRKVQGTNSNGDLVWYIGSYIGSPDGGTHELSGNTLDGSGFGPAATGFADSAGTLYYPGAYLSGIKKIIEDTNGNKMTQDMSGNWTDSLGRYIPAFTTTNTSGCPTGTASATAANLPTVNGGTINLKACFKNFSVSIAFPNGSGAGNPLLMTAVLLPDGTKWSFNYDSTGSLSTITLPTGGTISYTYGTYQFQAPDYSRAVTSRAVNANDGTSAHTTTYSYLTNGVRSTVVDPAGNQAEHDFGTAYAQFETAARYYAGSGAQKVLLKTVTTTYTAGVADPFYNAPACYVQVFPTSVTTTLGNKTSRTTTAYDDPNVTGLTWTFSDNFTDPPIVTTYPLTIGSKVLTTASDWGTSPNPGPVLRKTVSNYLWQTDSAAKANNLMNLLSSQIIQDGAGTRFAETDSYYDQTSAVSSGVTTQHNTPPTATKRGNQTTTARWLSGTTFLSSTATNFDTGMVQTSTDPGGHATTYAYSATFKGAYPTQVTGPTTGVAHVTSANYDFNTGLVTSSTDENGQVASLSYDTSFRLIQKSLPDGGQVNWAYTNAAPFKVTVTQKITASMNLTAEGEVDGVGRVKQTRLTSDPEGTDYTATTYDVVGHVATVSNPYRTGDTVYVTTTKYDAFGRAIKTIPTDGTDATNNVVTSYSDNCSTVTDEAGKSRKTCSDGLGRLTEVREDPATLNYATYYDYDALGNLTCVKQTGGATANQSCGSAPSSWRKRTFTYDALSRLTQAVNPESGTINYTYDNDGNLLTKLDARAITVTYAYDALHRLTGKTYSNGDPAVSYLYDQTSYNGLTITNPKPHRTGMADNTSNVTAWSYDTVGHVVSEKRTVSSITKTTSYTYNLDGSLATLVYPSGRTITYAYSAAGRLLSGIDSANSINYATVATYGPWGALAGVKYGVTGTFTGIVTSNSYNKRLQPSILSATAPSQTVLSLTYDFHLSGSDNNGNVYGITNNRDAYRSLVGSASYTYDALNRLATAASTGTDCTTVNGFTKNWGESFTIDAWGNLNGITTTKCTAEGLSVSDSSYKNQMDQYCYDAVGNLVAANASGCPGSTLYTYDAENRLVSASGVTYTYDGDGKRVKKSNGKLYWGSGPLTETDASGTATSDYAFFGGKRIARIDLPSGVVHYYFSDHLGTHGVVTNATATAIEQESDNYPFGGERVLTAGPNNYKFTGKERDSESNLTYFGARFYASNLGRFTSVDPKLASGTPFDAQGWNRYEYVRNNPIVLIDSDGRDWDTVWQDINTFAREIYAKVTIGFGAGGKIKSASGGVQLEAAKTISLEHNKGTFTTSHSVEVGASAKPVAGGPGIGESISVEQKIGSHNFDNGTGSGPGEPHAEVIDTLGGNSEKIGGSEDRIGIGIEAGEGLVGGGEIGATMEGWGALADAISNVKDEIFLPTPPPPKPPDLPTDLPQ